MTRYQPINPVTGEHGPAFEFATLAALWVLALPDSRGWTWGVVSPLDRNLSRHSAGLSKQSDQTQNENEHTKSEV